MRCLNLLLILSVLSFSAYGCGSNEPRAHFSSVNGKVDYRSASANEWKSAKVKQGLFDGDTIKTSSDGTAKIEFKDKSKVVIRNRTIYKIAGAGYLGNQLSGTAIFNIEKQKSKISVKTPHGDTTVLGTQFSQTVSSDSFSLIVKKGLVEFETNSGEKRRVKTGEKLNYQKGKPLADPKPSSIEERDNIFNAKTSLELFRR